jgi:hypothetical protein
MYRSNLPKARTAKLYESGSKSVFRTFLLFYYCCVKEFVINRLPVPELSGGVVIVEQKCTASREECNFLKNYRALIVSRMLFTSHK